MPKKRPATKLSIIAILSILCLFSLRFTFAAEFENTTGNKTLTTATTVTADKCIDDGDLTINPSITLQINANSSLTFEPGHQISKPGAYILKSTTNARIIKQTATCSDAGYQCSSRCWNGVCLPDGERCRYSTECSYCYSGKCRSYYWKFIGYIPNCLSKGTVDFSIVSNYCDQARVGVKAYCGTGVNSSRGCDGLTQGCLGDYEIREQFPNWANSPSCLEYECAYITQPD